MTIEQTTPVVFRAYPDDEVIALFPTLEEHNGLITCYVHVGQHGSADWMTVIQQTKPAVYWQYKDLLNELKDIGYEVKVYNKWNRRWGK